MKFRQFAFRNVTRNRRTYAAYFLSSAFSVMMFFIYAMFISHPDINNGSFGVAQEAIKIAEYIIYIFSFFFVLYSVSAFLKSRKHEFGVLMMHGMSRMQLNLLVFMENMMIGLGAILAGLIVGMIFSNLFLLIGAEVLGIEKLAFYWPWKAWLITAVAFVILFFVISLFTAMFVRSNKLIELLKGHAKPKTDPKASIVRSIIAAVLILIGYAVSFMVVGVQVILALFPVVIIVTIGTYFLFSQLIVYTIRRLKRSRVFYWRRTNLIVISDMAYRMKDNARMYFIVAIVSTVTICALGTFSGFQQALEQDIKDRLPYSFNYISYAGNEHEQEHQHLIDTKLHVSGVQYSRYTAERTVVVPDHKEAPVVFISLSDFNQLSLGLGYAIESLAEDQLLEIKKVRQFPADAIVEKNQDLVDQQKVELNGKSYMVTKTLERHVVPDRFTNSNAYYVISDEQYASLSGGTNDRYVAYHIPDLKQAAILSEEIQNEISGFSNSSFVSQSQSLLQLREIYGLLLFVGIFISIVFFVATGSFLYFRLYTDLAEDKRHYQAISKIGLAIHELKKIATTQVAILFYAPFIVAAMHSSVALYALHSFFDRSILYSTVMVIGIFFAAQTLFFLFIRSRYVKHLQEVIR